MNTPNNIVPLRKGALPRPAPMAVSESNLNVAGDDYIVRRAAFEDGHGFSIVRDSDDRAILIFSSSFPEAYVAQLVLAFRAGHQVGLARGQRDGISIVPDNQL